MGILWGQNSIAYNVGSTASPVDEHRRTGEQGAAISGEESREASAAARQRVQGQETRESGVSGFAPEVDEWLVLLGRLVGFVSQPGIVVLAFFTVMDSGKMAVAARRNAVVRRKQCEVKIDKEEKTGGDDDNVGVESGNVVSGNSGPLDASDSLEIKKRCGWVTPSTDPCYATFHDEEWGVQVHDDEKLFELLCLSGALSELTWPVILNRRHIFRDVFLDFNPIAVSKLNDKKIAVPGSPASSLLSELKLRSIIENARQMCKVIDEFGSFDKYIWNFVNHKPIVNQFRYSRQVPVKTPKAELISKDLVRRGFRSVGPTVIYSFMQAAGLTNDHLVSCFRFQECINGTEVREKDESLKPKTEKKETMDPIDVGIPRAMDNYSSSK
ncbi:hypothetical protein GH714_025335 [Hevea brasiliensis]|uniref:Uncharacterized protein n=1 Tax=Hevea brasiliensis TaxID=3981 RepID=A0A6A6LJ82_HEVBR|nr:hypothetical protein GH714_025335 [Hevea brasiliensis]